MRPSSACVTWIAILTLYSFVAVHAMVSLSFCNLHIVFICCGSRSGFILVLQSSQCIHLLRLTLWFHYRFALFTLYAFVAVHALVSISCCNLHIVCLLLQLTLWLHYRFAISALYSFVAVHALVSLSFCNLHIVFSCCGPRFGFTVAVQSSHCIHLLRLTLWFHYRFAIFTLFSSGAMHVVVSSSFCNLHIVFICCD